MSTNCQQLSNMYPPIEEFKLSFMYITSKIFKNMHKFVI